MAAIARVGDLISHGGQITTGSTTCLCNGRKVARVGDLAICSIHGPNRIVTGSNVVLADGRFVALQGSLLSCGARIVTGSKTVTAGS